MDQIWIDYIFKAGVAIFSGGALVKVINHFIQKDKVKAEADKIKVEAESSRAKVYQELLDNVMKQLGDVRNENLLLVKQMSQLRIDHIREIDDERKSCAENMIALSDRIRELETINRINKS